MEKLLEKGTIEEACLLPSEPKVCMDLVKWLCKAYPSMAPSIKLEEAGIKFKSCLKALLQHRMNQFNLSLVPRNRNQETGLKLAQEQANILSKYIKLLDSL